MTPPAGIVVVAAVTFAAAFAQGVTGFGSALLAMPLLALVVGVRTAAPLMALLSLAINLSLLIPARGHLPWRRAAPLVAGSLLGVPAGVLFLAGADERLARIALGVALVASGALLMRSRRLPIPPGWEPAFAAGGVAGLLGGAFNTNGPVVLIYAASQPWTKEETHALLQLYFLASNLVIVALHGLTGLTTPGVIRLAAAGLPALAAGALAGWAVHRRVSEERFRKVTQVALVAAGIALLMAR